jgi:hypothetical protein
MALGKPLIQDDVVVIVGRVQGDDGLSGSGRAPSIRDETWVEVEGMMDEGHGTK